MAKSIDDIIKELDAGYDPSRKLINERLSALQPEADAEIAGLAAQERDYYDNTIMAGARQRGIGFSGIPEGDRAKFGASAFLPAVARVKSSQNDRKLSLTEALTNTNLEQRQTAMKLRQQELDREEQQRQFDAQIAEARRTSGGGGGSFAPTLSMPTRSTAPAPGAQPQAPSLQSFLKAQYSSAPTANRATQDAWVRQWAAASGQNPNDPTLWAAYDKMYPYNQYSDQARTKAPAGTTINRSSALTFRGAGLPAGSIGLTF